MQDLSHAIHDTAPILRDLVILVAVAIPVVGLAHRLRVPSVVGFLLTGIAIGPRGLGFIGDPESVAGLAELGVVLLLFAIGLELSLSRIIGLGRSVLQGGGLQVGLTIAAVAGLGVVAGVPVNQALFYGGLIALSSTAIVLKVYADRQELDTPHGRVVVAVLLFQDLCVVPLMLLLPLLADSAAGLEAGAVWSIAVSLAVVGGLVLAGRLVVPWILEQVVGFRNRELFTLCVGLFGLGAAYVTASVGLSLALGAFIAGLVISESEYGAAALSDVLPFRDVFSGIFFTSVGMLLDLGYVASRPGIVVGAAAIVLVLKTGIAAAVVRSLRRSLVVSVQSGLGLAQVGEFSFILAGVGAPLGLLDDAAYQLFLGAAVLSMLAAPFVIATALPVAQRVARLVGRRAVGVARAAIEEEGLSDHAIIVGYGLSGRRLARVLREAGLPYVVIEQNGQLVRRARLEGEPVLFGDGTRRDVLEHVGVARARVLVLSIASPADERRGVAVARQANPDVRIIVRTRYVAAINDLKRLGATEIVVEEYEAALELFARVLQHYEIPSNTVEQEVALARGEQYEFLRGVATPNLRLDALRHLRIHTALDLVEVEEGAPAVGESPTSLHLRRATGASVIAVIRNGVALYTPDPSFRFRAGDTVVLVGNRDALAAGGALFRATRNEKVETAGPRAARGDAV